MRHRRGVDYNDREDTRPVSSLWNSLNRRQMDSSHKICIFLTCCENVYLLSLFNSRRRTMKILCSLISNSYTMVYAYRIGQAENYPHFDNNFYTETGRKVQMRARKKPQISMIYLNGFINVFISRKNIDRKQTTVNNFFVPLSRNLLLRNGCSKWYSFT